MENKNSNHEKEKLTVMWEAEHVQNYILARLFTVKSGYKDLQSLLNGTNEENETLF